MTLSEFKACDKTEYTIVDIRDSMAFEYGNIPGSINIPSDMIKDSFEELSGKKVLLYCNKGDVSAKVCESMKSAGIDACSLENGYLGWIMEDTEDNAESDSEFVHNMEESIRKKFHKSIWCNFTKAIREYELVKPGDRIAVCISGGKDSMLMAKCFQELKRHNKFDFDVKFIVMDPGYSESNRKLIEMNARKMNVPITVFETDIFESVFDVKKSPCYLCARMRRGHLYNMAQKLGCNKIALGHHYDDVIETILMGMLYGAQVQTMMPKLHSTNFPGMELIRPLYLVREDDIKAWRDYNSLHFIQCACKFTESCSTCEDTHESESKRKEVKKLIRELRKTNEFVESNIFNSVTNVNLSTVIAYKKDGIVHNFLDTYDEDENENGEGTLC